MKIGARPIHTGGRENRRTRDSSVRLGAYSRIVELGGSELHGLHPPIYDEIGHGFGRANQIPKSFELRLIVVWYATWFRLSLSKFGRSVVKWLIDSSVVWAPFPMPPDGWGGSCSPSGEA
jgi:hypothetical protein